MTRDYERRERDTEATVNAHMTKKGVLTERYP
jgi:hypothetical protein